MNILLVIDSLGAGGAQNQLTLLAQAWRAQGHTITVFSYYDHDFFKHRIATLDIKHIHIPKQDHLGLNVIRALRIVLEQEPFTIALSYLNTPNFYLMLAAYGLRLETQLMVSYRSMTDLSNLSWWKRLQYTWVNRQADIIVANSHHERERWQNAYPQLAAKWRTIYNVVDLIQFQPNTNTGKYTKSKTLVGVGKVRPLKNVSTLVDALHYLQQQNLAVPKVHWYGARKFKRAHFQQVVTTIEQKIADYGLQDVFIWKKPTPDLGLILPEYYALIHPSLWEGLPNAICEALAAGLPVLASDILDHPQLVSTERGYMFDPSSAEEIAMAIHRMITVDEATYQQMSLAARQYAEHNFAEQGVLKLYNEAFNG